MSIYLVYDDHLDPLTRKNIWTSVICRLYVGEDYTLKGEVYDSRGVVDGVEASPHPRHLLPKKRKNKGKNSKPKRLKTDGNDASLEAMEAAEATETENEDEDSNKSTLILEESDYVDRVVKKLKEENPPRKIDPIIQEQWSQFNEHGDLMSIESKTDFITLERRMLAWCEKQRMELQEKTGTSNWRLVADLDLCDDEGYPIMRSGENDEFEDLAEGWYGAERKKDGCYGWIGSEEVSF